MFTFKNISKLISKIQVQRMWRRWKISWEITYIFLALSENLNYVISVKLPIFTIFSKIKYFDGNLRYDDFFFEIEGVFTKNQNKEWERG